MTWARATLGEVSLMTTSGGTPSRKNPEYYTEEGGHLWVKSKELLDNGISDTEEKISDLGLKKSAAKYLPRHTVLVAMYGANVGQLAWLKERATVNQAICGVVVDPEKADWRYIYYAIMLEREKLMAKAQGAAQQNLNQGLVRDFDVPLPPLPTQRKIAAILSAYDDLIENNTRRVRVLEQMARALYREWFVEYRFPGHEQAQWVEDETGRRPQGWEWKQLGDVAQNFDRLRKPLSKMQREKFKGPYPYYGAAKVFDYVAEYIFDGKYLLLAEDGSVETKDGKPVLQLVNEKFWPNNHTHILQGIEPVSTEYLYLVMGDTEIRPYITGAAQPKITQANMNSIPVLVADSAIFELFNPQILALLELVATLERRNANLRRTRDLLLPRLVSGELDVSGLRVAGPGLEGEEGELDGMEKEVRK